MKKKAIAIVQTKEVAMPTNISPAQLIVQTVKKTGNVEDLKELLLIQKDWEANEARKEYYISITNFRRKMPILNKDAKVDFTSTKGRTHYKYTSLANALETANPILSEFGLSVTYRTMQQNGNVGVFTRVSHEKGHYEETYLEAHPDDSGNKNSIQQIGSTIAYLQRYGAFALLGLASRGQDDDGKTSGKPEVEQPKELSIKDMVYKFAKDKFKSPDLFQAWRVDMGLPDKMEGLPDFQLTKILVALQGKK